MTTTTTTTTNYGQLLDPATVRFERVLPGPIERVWDYLTVSEKRAKWLASGEIDLRVGGTGTLTFKNAELSSIVEETPAEYRQDHDCGIDQPIRVTQIEKPRLLASSGAATRTTAPTPKPSSSSPRRARTSFSP
jgi:uncharacterized protein YndB with AHSA1/START domain